MIKDAKTLIDAKRIALSDGALGDSLRSWYSHKGEVHPACREYDFSDWLIWMIGEMSDKVGIDYPEYPDEKQLVLALRICSIGDPIALAAADAARKNGFESDINCYVEDGVVYSSVWVKGDGRCAVEEYAYELAYRIGSLGYSHDVHVDDEDDREATLNASIDFNKYEILVGRGNPMCMLGFCPMKCYNKPEMKVDDGIQERIIEIVSEHTGKDKAKVSDSSSFELDYNFDELDMAEFLMSVEDEFGIGIPDEDAEKLKVVKDVIDYVRRRLNGSEPAKV